MAEIYVVILNTPNANPPYRLVGVFSDRTRAEEEGRAEEIAEGNDSWYHIVQDDGKDIKR